MNNITTEELKSPIPNVKIIDIRDNYKYNVGNIPTSKNVPANFLLTNPDNYLNYIDKYYIYCEYGSTSSRECNILKN